MAALSSVQSVVQTAQLASASFTTKKNAIPQSSLLGVKAKKSSIGVFRAGNGPSRIHMNANKSARDRWSGLSNDISDDQQDITRGKGMVDSLFQGHGVGMGTQDAVLSSWDYISQGQRHYDFDNMKDGFYIAPAFMDKLVVHLAKNFMKLPNIKVPLILGVWGGKGQGKSFQSELIMAKLGINPIVMSAGELESGNAGEPAKLIRQRYREASDIIKKGKMCCLFINDLDAGAGRMGGTTQYTVNNQMVNATLMNIADNPTNVQLPGIYNKEEIPRVPIIVTGNDFSTLYAPLIRDGRMEKFYWAPTREDRIGVTKGIFRLDNIPDDQITTLVDTFPGQSIDFFGALRARVYDDEVRKWITEVGVENMGKKLVNSRDGPPTFDQPKMTLDTLLGYGWMLVQEQENVKRVQLAEEYLSGAALGDANADADKGYYTDKKKAAAPSSGQRGASPAPTPRAAPEQSSSSLDDIVPIIPKSHPRAAAGRGRGRSRSPVRRVPSDSSSSDNSSYGSGSSFFDAPAPEETYTQRSSSLDDIVPIIPKNPVRAFGSRGRGRSRSPVRQVAASSSRRDVSYETSSYDTNLDDIVPIIPKDSGRSAGLRGRGRSRSPVRRGPASSPAPSYEAPSYSAPEPVQLDDIVPIIPKNPTRALGGRGRGRSRSPVSRSGTPSSASSYEAPSYSAPTVNLDDIVPIIPKDPSRALGGRGRGRSRSPVRRSVSPPPSRSYEAPSYSAPTVNLDDIVPIIPRNPVVRGGRGRSRSPVRRSSSTPPNSYEAPSYSAPTVNLDDIVPIIPKNPVVRGGRGGRGRSRSPVRRSLSPPPSSYESSYSAPTVNLDDIVPIIPKDPTRAFGGRGRGRSRSPVRRSVSPSRSYEAPSYSSPEPTVNLDDIVPIIPRNPTVARGRGGRGRSRSPVRRSVSPSQSSYGSDSYSSPSVDLDEIVPIIPRNPTVARGRGGRGRSRSPVRRSVSPSSSSYDTPSYSASSVDLDDIVPIIPKNPSRPVGGRGRGRSRSPVRRVAASPPHESNYSSYSPNSYDESSYSAPEATNFDEIVPIIPKNPRVQGGRGRGRSRSPVRRVAASPPNESNYSSYESEFNSTLTSLDDIVPIIPKRDDRRGRSRGRRPVVAGKRSASYDGYSSGDAGYSSSESGYYSGDSGYYSDSTIEPTVNLDDIVPIIPKNPAGRASRGRGGRR